ncbi:hypothetical protein [Ruminiclostridium sufflavum]|nr:hypothetical protein [Ruminiclostridium sufflavum]
MNDFFITEEVQELTDMVKKRKMTDLMKEIRRSWVINPRTRVQENELKNKKKRRQNERKLETDREV